MKRFFPWKDAPGADFAVIGDPVAHSLSPIMHAAAYRELAIDYEYVAVHVQTGEVREALDHLRQIGYRGVNVTVPHKEEVLNWPREVDPVVMRVRAANTIDLVGSRCINTDAPGFLETLARFDFGLKSAMMLGAGGSARSLAFALVANGWSLRIFNRTAEKGEALAKDVGASFISELDPEGSDLVLNTTSASLQGEDLPIDWSKAAPDTVAYDLMYSKEQTPFLQSAAKRGLQTVDGLPLLVAQGALSLEWWLGLPAPREQMARAVQDEMAGR